MKISHIEFEIRVRHVGVCNEPINEFTIWKSTPKPLVAREWIEHNLGTSAAKDFDKYNTEAINKPDEETKGKHVPTGNPNISRPKDEGKGMGPRVQRTARGNKPKDSDSVPKEEDRSGE